jgi:hypothetical protein
MPDLYIDPEAIQALETNPDAEALLVEYALSTGGVQLGLVSPSGGAAATYTVIIEGMNQRPRGPFSGHPKDVEIE